MWQRVGQFVSVSMQSRAHCGPSPDRRIEVWPSELADGRQPRYPAAAISIR